MKVCHFCRGTYLKWVAITLILLVVLVAIFVLSFDLNRYRQELQTAVSQALGREVVFSGNLSLGIALLPTVVIEGVKVSNPAWTSRSDFATIGRLKLQLELLPLLKGDFIVRHLQISQADILLESTQDGLFNGHFGPVASTSSETDVLIDIQDISILDSRITLKRENKQMLRLDINSAVIEAAMDSAFSLKLDGSYQQRPLQLTLKAGQLTNLYSRQSWPVDIKLDSVNNHFEIAGAINPSNAGREFSGKLTYRGNDLSSLPAITGYDVIETGPVDLSMDVRADISSVSLQRITLKLLSKSKVHQLSLFDGRVDFGNQQTLSVNLDGSYQGLQWRFNLQGATLNDMLVSAKPWPISTKLTFQDNTLEVSGTVSSVFIDNKVKLKIKVSGDDLQQLQPLFSNVLPVIGKYKLIASLSGSRKVYRAKIKTAMAAKSIVSGIVDIDASGRLMKLSADLSVNKLYISDFYEQSLDSKQQKNIDDFLYEKISIQTPTNMSIRYKLSVGEIEGAVVDIKDVVVSGMITKDRVIVSPLTMMVAGEKLIATLDLKSVDDAVDISFKVSGRQLDLAEFLNATGINVFSMCKVAQADFSIKSQGSKLRDIIENGDIRFSASNAKLVFNTSNNSAKTLSLDDFSITSVRDNVVEINSSGIYQGAPVSVELSMDRLIDRVAGVTSMPLLLSLSSNKEKLIAKGTINKSAMDHSLDFVVSLKGTQIQLLSPFVGTSLPAMGSYDISAKLNSDKLNYRFTDLKGHVGRSDVMGDLVVNLDQSSMKVTARLQSKSLFYDDIFPENKKLVTDVVDVTDKRVLPLIKLPLKLMQSANFDLDISAKHLFIADVDFTDLMMRIHFGNDSFEVSPFNINLGAGSISGAFKSQLADETYITRLNVAADNIDYGTLFARIGITEQLEGTVKFDIDLSGEGLDLREILGSANGKVSIVSGPGRIKQTKLDLWAADIFTIALTSAWQPVDDAKVNCMVGQFVVKDGLLSSDSLLLDTTRITVAGSGSLNLRTEDLNLLITPAPKLPSFISLAKPVRLVGKLDSPKVEEDRFSRAWSLGGILAGLANPATLLFMYGNIGTLNANPCLEAVQLRESEEAKAIAKGQLEPSKLPSKLLKKILRPFQ